MRAWAERMLPWPRSHFFGIGTGLRLRSNSDARLNSRPAIRKSITCMRTTSARWADSPKPSPKASGCWNSIHFHPHRAIISAGTTFMPHEFDRAIEQYKLVLAIDPNFAEGHRQLAEAYSEKGKFDEAVAEMNRRFDIIGGGDDVQALKKAYAMFGWK